MAETQTIIRPIPESLSARPILDLAASVWDADRYDCFRLCYRSMRRLDDLVDHRKELPEPISPQERLILSGMLTDWLDLLSRRGDEKEIARLNSARDSIGIPLWPWEKLVRAMHYDLANRSFPSWLVFRRYTEGAAIAPAAVFIYLAVADARALSPHIARVIALPLALFAYLVHIIRDLRHDLERGLFYIPDAWLARHDLNQVSLQLLFGEDREIDDHRFTKFLSEYADVVRWFEQRSKKVISEHAKLFRPDGLLSLQLVRALYGQLADRLYLVRDSFEPECLQPSEAEIRALLSDFSVNPREDITSGQVS